MQNSDLNEMNYLCPASFKLNETGKCMISNC